MPFLPPNQQCQSTEGTADCSLKNNFCVIYYNFWHAFIPYTLRCEILAVASGSVDDATFAHGQAWVIGVGHMLKVTHQGQHGDEVCCP